MDPRQPQHPFGRNNSSPYGRAPFQQNSNQAPFPPSSHPQSGPPGPPGYPESQRRPSDATYYVPPRSYPQEAPSMPAPSHSRHQSSSSIGHGTPVSRNMPPPSSPQQQQTQHSFPQPLPRGPPPSLGAPMSSLTSSRDLPTLPPLHRPGSSMSISSMLGNPAPSTRDSGYQPPQFPGPLPFTNAAHPSTSYPPSRGLISIAEPASAFGRRIRTPEPARSQELQGPRDNRANSAGSPPRGISMLTSPEVSRYNTPHNYSQRPGPQIIPGEERREPYPVRVPHTSLPPRPNSQPTAFSAPPPPPRPVDIGRSEMPPYGRHGYGSDRDPAYAYAERERQEKEAAIIRERERERDRENREREFKRERERDQHPDRERQERERRESEAAMQREALHREHERREFEDHSRIYATERGRRELLEREREQQRAQEQRVLNRELEQRERERERERENEQRRGYLERENERARERDREMAEREHANIPPPYAHQQSHHPYGRQYEPREQQQVPWARPGYEHPPPDSRPQQQQPSYEPPRATQPAYPPASAAHQPTDTRYPSTSQPQSAINHHGPAAASQNYESSLHDRQRREMAQSQQPFAYPSTGNHAGPSLYQPHESPKRKQEDELKMMQQQQQQRERLAYLAVGGQQEINREINRRGRLSPLPQAVQGAQGQSTGPVVEPGIKSEFGKMFSGIGSGAIGMSATSSSISHTPFSNPRHSHRDDSESNAGHDTNGESAHKANVANRGGRRRKLKEDDNRDEDGSSTGRRTPSIRGQSKRPKIHHPPGGSSNNIHTNVLANRQPDTEHASQTNGTPFKNSQAAISPVSDMKGQAGVVVPHHHHVVRTHHHHHHVPQSQKPQNLSPPGPTIPRHKNIIRSKSVIDSVAHFPRYHLGSTVYSSDLKPPNPSANSAARVHPSRRGFSSTPTPLPRFDDRENCTCTVHVPQVYLSKESREEITARRPVWGTDIYTDDSDVIAACIHAGWIRGEWPEDVDISLLDLEVDVPDPAPPEAMPPSSRASEKKGKSATKQVQLLTEPPPRGPMIPPENKDLHITVLVLPTLEKYSSTTRWGIKSREWATDHDGLSFMILEIKWVEADMKGLGLRERKKAGKRMRMFVRDDGDREGEDEREKKLWDGLRGGDAMDVDGDGGRGGGGQLQESFVRGDGAGTIPLNFKFKGLGMGSWWLRGEEREKEPEKEDGRQEEQVLDHDRDQGSKSIAIAEPRAPPDDVATAAIQGLTELAAGGDRERNRGIGSEVKASEREEGVAGGGGAGGGGESGG